jgi:hypothetical protein
MFIYKVVQIWPEQTVTCLHTNSSGHIWTTLYVLCHHQLLGVLATGHKNALHKYSLQLGYFLWLKAKTDLPSDFTHCYLNPVGTNEGLVSTYIDTQVNKSSWRSPEWCWSSLPIFYSATHNSEYWISHREEVNEVLYAYNLCLPLQIEM